MTEKMETTVVSITGLYSPAKKYTVPRDGAIAHARHLYHLEFPGIRGTTLATEVVEGDDS